MAINVEVGIKDDSFRRSMKLINDEVKILDDTIRTLSNSTDDLENDLQTVGKINEATARKTELLTQKLKLQKQQLEAGEDAVTQYRQELQKLDTTTDKGKASAEKLTTAIKNQEQANSKLKTSIQNTEAKLSTMNTSLKTTKTNAESAGTAIQTMGAQLKNINWTQIGQALVTAGQEMVNFGQKGVQVFSNLVERGANYASEQEQINMLYKNQGKLSKQAINNQVKLASAYGLTENQMRAGATELSSYFKAIGMSDEATADLVNSNIELVANMSAFANVPFDEALADIKSGLMGNYEALDKYAISIGAANLEESEYVKTLGKKWSELSEQEKIYAILAMAQQQSADYSGLARQEAESFTTQANLLKTQLQETAGAIGMQLLPVLQPLLEKVVSLVEKFANWAEENPELCNTILMVVGAISGLAVVFGTLAVGLGTAIILFSTLSAPILIVIGVIAALVAGLVALWVNWDSVSNWVGEKWDWLCSKVTEIATNIKTWVTTKWQEMCAWVSEKTSALVAAVTDFFDNFWYNVGYYLGLALSTIVQFCIDQYNEFCEWVPKAVDAVVEWFGDMKEKAKDWLDKVIDDLIEWGKDMFDKGVEAGENLVEGVGEWLSELPGKMYDWGVNAIQGFIDGIKSLIGNVGSLISGVIDGWNGGGGAGGGNDGGSTYTTTFKTVGEPYTNLASTYARTMSTLDLGSPTVTYGVSAYAIPDSPESQSFIQTNAAHKTNGANIDDLYDVMLQQNKLLMNFLQEKKININIDQQILGSMTKDEASLSQIRFWSKL